MSQLYPVGPGLGVWPRQAQKWGGKGSRGLLDCQISVAVRAGEVSQLGVGEGRDGPYEMEECGDNENQLNYSLLNCLLTWSSTSTALSETQSNYNPYLSILILSSGHITLDPLQDDSTFSSSKHTKQHVILAVPMGTQHFSSLLPFSNSHWATQKAPTASRDPTP